MTEDEKARQTDLFVIAWIVLYGVMVIVLVYVFVALGVTSAKAEPPDNRAVFVLKDSPGGALAEFTLLALTLEQNKSRVIIDGQCASSCTILFAAVYDLDICVTNTAVLRFHYPYTVHNNGKSVVYTDGAKETSRVIGKTWFSMLPTKLQKLAPLSKWPSVYNGGRRSSTYDVPGALLVEQGIVNACE